MISSGCTSSVLLLVICVSLSQLGTSMAACQYDKPNDCTSCAQCTSIQRPGDNYNCFIWVNDNSTSAVPGNGTCVHFYDPPGSLSKADYGSSKLCGKLIFDPFDFCRSSDPNTPMPCPKSSPVSPKSAASALKLLSTLTSLIVAFMLVA